MDKKMGRHGGRRLAPIRYRLVTFAACRPLGPEVTSNSTAWPSFSDLYPSAWMAEKWTKMSSPDWRWMNPNPLLALNHLTVPCSFTVFPFHYFELFGASRPPPAVLQKRAASKPCIPLIESKGVTRATNANADYHEFLLSPSEFAAPLPP